MKLQDNLFEDIKSIILHAREKVFRFANSTLLESYWFIGSTTVENEQKGKAKAEYGKTTLKNLSVRLTVEFGKGFDYQILPICGSFIRLSQFLT